MRAASLAVALLGVCAAARGQALPPPRRQHALAGPWHVEGAARLRHLSTRDGRLCLIGVWDEALGAVELREREPRADPGSAWRLEGAGIDSRGPWLTLELREVADGGLEAQLRAGGGAPATERWWRVGRPGLELRRASPEGAGLELELAVLGQPQAVTLRVLAGDDPRYEHLGGVVHEERLAGGRPLPVGVYLLRWDGRDRSAGARPVLPGRYRAQLSGPEDGLPPSGGAATPASVAGLEVQLGPPPRPLVFRGAVQALVGPPEPAPPVRPADPEAY